MDKTTLKHFITFELWQQALRLLDFQIKSQEKNMHYKTLNMIYFKNLGDSVKNLNEQDYYNNKISNDAFYCLSKEFSYLPYILPKDGLGLRKYKFFSYPLRALYYTIGLYLLKLSQEFITNYVKKSENIKSFYGCNISFKEDELLITSQNIYFKKHYKRFRNLLRKEISGDTDRKIIIRIDIQNYFDEISIPILLKKLSKYIKATVKEKFKFDPDTQKQIISFFRLLSKDGAGIPQGDNDIISNFIGYLYLTFGDLYIEQEIFKDKDIVESYKIIRYLDDIYISIKFKNNVIHNSQQEYTESLGSRIADILYFKLNSRLNPKTRFFWLDNQEQKDELINSLKKISPEYHISDDENEEEPSNKIENIFDELEKLKVSPVEPRTFRHELQDEILKEIFDKSVQQMLKIESNSLKIKDIFEDFNFNLVKENPLPIILIILNNDIIIGKFRDFLKNKKYITTRDVNIILKYLCQKDFKDDEILSKLEEYKPFENIIQMVKSNKIPLESPGYYNLDYEKTSKIFHMPYVIEQVRFRILSEQNKSYSICYSLDDNTDHQKYDAESVLNFLRSKNVPHEICILIRNLFDRTNSNQISHPGCDESITWTVPSHEYFSFRTNVGECLFKLL